MPQYEVGEAGDLFDPDTGEWVGVVNRAGAEQLVGGGGGGGGDLTADAIADVLEAAPTMDPAALARIQASVSGDRQRLICGKYELDELLPTHTWIIDPADYSGTIATNGNLSAVYDSTKSSIPGHGSIKVSASAAVTTTQVRIPINADQWGNRGRIGSRMHVEIECSDWTKITRLYLQPSNGGGVAHGYLFAPIEGLLSYHGMTNPAFASRWTGIRTLVFCSDKVTAKVGTPPAWGTSDPASRYYTPDGFAVQMTTTGPVDLWIHRVYSPEWPVGYISLIGDGCYSSFRDYFITPFAARKWKGGVSLYQRKGQSGVAFHPTDADLRYAADCGWDVFVHACDQSNPAAPVALGTPLTQAGALKSIRAVTNYLISCGVDPQGLKWIQCLQNGASALASGTSVDAFKALGITGARARNVDPIWGIDPFNGTYQQGYTYGPETTGGWLSGWASPWGQYNIIPMDAFTTAVNSPLARDTFGGSYTSNVINFCANFADGATIYGHQFVPYDGTNPGQYDNGTNFAAEMLAALDSHFSAGKLIMLSPSEVNRLTYGRQGIYMRWDNAWVHQDDPTRIAF